MNSTKAREELSVKSKSAKKQKKITQTFEYCPACGSFELQKIDDDQFCLNCGWDTLLLSVNRGDLDDLIFDYEVKMEKQRIIDENKENNLNPLNKTGVSAA